MNLEQIHKISTSQGGIPVKRFEEDPDLSGYMNYLAFSEHHEKETTVLHSMLKEMAQKLDSIYCMHRAHMEISRASDSILQYEDRLENFYRDLREILDLP